jgi:hypothetical protein
MDDIFKPVEEKRGINPVFIVGILIGVAAIAVAIYFLSFKPPMDQQAAKILEGSVREGTPEIAELSKDIVLWTDRDTVQSPTGMGTISMYIRGNIRNKGTRTVTALEVNAAVVTEFGDVLREKRVLVVPIQQSVLNPGDTIPITLTLDGFDRKDDRADIKWRVTAIKVEK